MLPDALRFALEHHQIKGKNQALLTKDAQSVSMRYRTQSGTGKPLLTNSTEALAYAIARMPATYGAVYSAIIQTINLENASKTLLKNKITLLDAGAGTGAASWAVNALLDLSSVVCLEREDAMRNLGVELMRDATNALKNAQWIKHDLNNDIIMHKAQLVIASYVLNEMTAEGRIRAAVNLWNATEDLLLIIEPGTPAGFANLKQVRDRLLASGAFIATPCPHNRACPLPNGDWCHFTCRVPRSRLHRQLKGGDAPFEDEKFAYLAFARKQYIHSGMRVLRHPQIHSGYITLTCCSSDGIQNITLTKKDGARYKAARKANAGDIISDYNDK